MSAVQLLEKLGSNADLQGNTQLASQILDEVNEHTETSWCLLFPADGEEPSDGEEQDSDEDSSTSITLN